MRSTLLKMVDIRNVSHFVFVVIQVIFCISQIVQGSDDDAFDTKCYAIMDNERFNCFPENTATEESCLARGCCWFPLWELFDQVEYIPPCFYPSNYPNYKFKSMNKMKNGYNGTLIRTAPTPKGSPFKDLPELSLTVTFETETRLRIRILDATKKRWEVPIPLDLPQDNIPNHGFDVSFTDEPFGVQILRKSDKMTLFDATMPQAPLRYADQFLQISAQVGVWKGYGQGETRGRLMRSLHQWFTQAYWARDIPPQVETNLYGVHNFFVGLAENGTAYGIFFLNSNAQEVSVQPLPAMTYRTIGGILDFFIFLGPNMQSVVSQYQQLIMRPILPPLWSLGFHLSRYGIHNISDLRQIHKRNTDAKIPFDVQVSDIDYMDSYLDWTYDKVRYAGFPDFIKEVQNENKKYVVIIDPVISNQRIGHYAAYDEGIKRGIFINISNSTSPIIGKAWSGTVVYPDFSNPLADEYWYDMAAEFFKEIKFDGLWIDMNEPSNFVDGSISGCPGKNLDHPPYVPSVYGNTLMAMTLCPSAQHYKTTHYNLHSMTGYFEAKSTNYALRKIHPNKRPFILTRSSFVGSGLYTFHWSGDNKSTWANMYFSIANILNFNMFGIPMMGAEICGFTLRATEELCIRWMQLGAFYPFMRNHNAPDTNAQDPAAWSPPAVNIMRSAVEIRYSILPYIYTLFYRSHINGTTVARPLSFEFAADTMTHDIDSQFMLGSGLLISPVLENGARSVHAYIPDAVWCDAYNGSRLSTRKTMARLDAPLDKINLHIRGGSIIPTLPPALNTVELRKGEFGLSICLNDKGTADGELFWDDGESFDGISKGHYNLIKFHADATQGSIVSNPIVAGYTKEKMLLNRVVIVGIRNKPSTTAVNGHSATFTYSQKSQILLIGKFQANLNSTILIKWH